MAIAWCPFAVKRPIVANNFSVGRSGQTVRAVVLHIAAGSLASVFPTFNDPQRQASAHFCVGKDGTIEQYVSINDTAFGNGLAWDAVNQQWLNARNKVVKPTWQDLLPKLNPNFYTVSIEHEGQSADTWTPEMYAANNRLLLWLAAQLNLTYVAHRTLIGHYEIDNVDKAQCPGPNVEYDRVVAELAAVTAAQKYNWMPINTDAALYQFAQTSQLGFPQTDEFTVTFGADRYLAQVFNLGIVYVKNGEWANCQWVKKP